MQLHRISGIRADTTARRGELLLELKFLNKEVRIHLSFRYIFGAKADFLRKVTGDRSLVYYTTDFRRRGLRGFMLKL